MPDEEDYEPILSEHDLSTWRLDYRYREANNVMDMLEADITKLIEDTESLDADS